MKLSNKENQAIKIFFEVVKYLEKWNNNLTIVPSDKKYYRIILNLINKLLEGWFISWDYAHYDDYDVYDEIFPENIRTNGKKWTTEEIFEEVKTAINQLKEMK